MTECFNSLNMCFLHQSLYRPTPFAWFLCYFGRSLYLRRVAGRCPKTSRLGSFFSYDLCWFWGLLLKTGRKLATDFQSVTQNQILFIMFHQYFNPVSGGSMALQWCLKICFYDDLRFLLTWKTVRLCTLWCFHVWFVRCIPILIIIPNDLGSITPYNSQKSSITGLSLYGSLDSAFVGRQQRPRSMLPPLIEANDTQGSRKVSGNVPRSELIRPFSDEPPTNNLMPFYSLAPKCPQYVYLQLGMDRISCIFPVVQAFESVQGFCP